MKAVIKTQGRQFTVQQGDILKVNRYRDTEAGSVVDIKEVLMFEDNAGIHVGNPLVANAVVHQNGPPVICFISSVNWS